MCRQGIWKNSLHSAQNDFLETNKQMNPQKEKDSSMQIYSALVEQATTYGFTV